jgi:hypothetical protein
MTRMKHVFDVLRSGAPRGPGFAPVRLRRGQVAASRPGRRAFSAVCRCGRPPGAVITGAAGVGKTTLAMTGLRVAEKRGMSVARAAATWASRGLPFGALAPFLPPDPGGDGLGREDRGELLRRYGRAVAGRARGRPLVVFVDDAHLLDGGSATLVHQLAPAIRGTRDAPPPPLA